MLKAVGIGDNVCDKYQHQGKMYPGGQALNFAVYCKGEGCQAAYLGVFGKDAVGAHVESTLQKLGIDTTHCRHVDGENGYAVVDLQDGDRVFVCSNKGGVLRENPLDLKSDDSAYLSGFDILHTSNNSYIDSQLPKLAALPGRLSYDFSGTWANEPRAHTVCQYIDFAFLSCSGLTQAQIRALLARMHSAGAAILVATRGEEGAIAYDGKAYYTHSPPRVKAVDTLGAGDSLAAGFLVRYLQEAKQYAPVPGSKEMEALMQASLQNGARLAAQTCMTDGAFGYGTAIE